MTRSTVTESTGTESTVTESTATRSRTAGSTTSESSRTAGDLFRIGLGVGTFGRWFRLLIGLNAVVYLSINPILLNPLPPGDLLPYFGDVALWFAGIATAYMAGVWLYARLPASLLNPWAGTAIFLGVPTLLRVFGIAPMSFQIAFGFYIGVSLIATFFMRYGGCEVIAFPSLFLRRRFTMYCPYNGIDAVERGVTLDGFSRSHRAVAILSLAITLIVGGYFLVEEISGFFGRYGLAFEIDDRAAWLLFIPTAYLAFMTVRSYRREKRILAAPVRKFGLGAGVLLLVAISLVSPAVATFQMWLGVMVVGTASVVVAAVRGGLRRLGTPCPGEAVEAGART